MQLINTLIRFTPNFLNDLKEVYSILEQSGMEYKVEERISYVANTGVELDISLPNEKSWTKSVESLSRQVGEVYLKNRAEAKETGNFGQDDIPLLVPMTPYLTKLYSLQPILDFCKEKNIEVSYDAYGEWKLDSRMVIKGVSPRSKYLESHVLELSKDDGLAWPREVMCHELGHFLAWERGTDSHLAELDEVQAWDIGEELFKQFYPGESTRSLRLVRKHALKSYGIEE